MRSHQRIRITQRKTAVKYNKNQIHTAIGVSCTCLSLLTVGLAGSSWFVTDSPVDVAIAASEQTPASEATIEAAITAAIPATREVKVSKGDTLLTLITDTGVSFEEAHDAVAAIREVYDPRRLNRGQSVAIELDPSESDPAIPTLSALSMPISGTATLELKREGDTFKAEKIEVPVEHKTVHLKKPINNSLYVTGRALGLSPNAIAELIKAYSYDVDFQRDIRKGHELEVVMDQIVTEDGKVVGASNLVYAALHLGKRSIPIYRFTDKSGYTAYYNEKGESLKKALLKTPINGAKISSGFGMRRHPIQGYHKMHKGVDFAASSGTPIYAAGDGTVEYAGWKSGYGNFVKVKHNGKYSTGYAHASRIAKGIKNGSRVKQGQVIAYVGSTGNSTGPHLHYEVYANGGQVNPSGVQFKTGTALAGADLKKFKGSVEKVTAMVKGVTTTKVAMNDSKTPGKVETKKN